MAGGAENKTPQQQLDDMAGSTRFKLTILAIVCAAALFLEFLLSVSARSALHRRQ